MRRQARISAGGARVVRSASALQVWLWLLIFVFQNKFCISGSIQPGYLDFDNLPETNFTCTGKVIGGYYADLETSCQMFHVCTVGQQDEPMDIKFLCLNGTVFDQETRVCERVDEVDCTKSEKFYSLNLELYGSTSPPIIQSEQTKPTFQTTVQQSTKPNTENDPSVDETPTSTLDKLQEHTDVVDYTEDPAQFPKKEEPLNPPSAPTASDGLSSLDQEEPGEDNPEIEESEHENVDYEDDYSHQPSSSSTQVPTTTTTKKSPPTTTLPEIKLSEHSSLSEKKPLSSPALASTSSTPSASSVPSAPMLDPSLLSPQEFIYRHRGPGSEAISFQRQSFRPADGVYITHAPPQQFDHFQYESSRTAPRPTPFVQRPQPFRATTIDPRNQLPRPGPSSQSSERHETSIKHRPYPYPSTLPIQRPSPFDHYYYDHKRSDESMPHREPTLSARSVPPPIVTERPPTKLKSPPRVIVTASASVSDSNGKRLNYTVGNVVSAVKPIVPINYDDYKESDLIFDPFFLDVPKLQKRRKTRSSKNSKVIIVPASVVTRNLPTKQNTFSTTTFSPVTSRATTTESQTTTVASTTTLWNPNDYVDDNYEPQAYIPPMPPFAFLLPQTNEYKKQIRQSSNNLIVIKNARDNKSKALRVVELRLTPSSAAAQNSSSQSAGLAAPAPAPLTATTSNSASSLSTPVPSLSPL